MPLGRTGLSEAALSTHPAGRCQGGIFVRHADAGVRHQRVSEAGHAIWHGLRDGDFVGSAAARVSGQARGGGADGADTLRQFLVRASRFGRSRCGPGRSRCGPARSPSLSPSAAKGSPASGRATTWGARVSNPTCRAAMEDTVEAREDAVLDEAILELRLESASSPPAPQRLRPEPRLSRFALPRSPNVARGSSPVRWCGAGPEGGALSSFTRSAFGEVTSGCGVFHPLGVFNDLFFLFLEVASSGEQHTQVAVDHLLAPPCWSVVTSFLYPHPTRACG